MKTRDFSFGIGIDGLDGLPEPIGNLLLEWSRSAVADMNSTDASNNWAIARSITHEDAAANIDVLAERLANVLRELAALPAETQE